MAERKAQKALDTANEYHETYRVQITMYESAERYLRDVLGERFDDKKLPPITKWTIEREKLTADLKRHYGEYTQLRTGTAEVEKIKRNVDDILREDRLEQQPTRARGMEL